ncbi:MAG: hypothetical protein Fur007_24400 [Rhodoferax sp.]
MGCDVCYTNHAQPDGDDTDAQLLMLGAGCSDIMGVPGEDDIMLNYQSTSFHDARTVLILIGEPPGLRSSDSLGAHLSWGAHLGCTHTQRNCVSKVRSAGLAITDAADTLHRLLERARTLQLSGRALKDDDASTILHSAP